MKGRVPIEYPRVREQKRDIPGTPTLAYGTMAVDRVSGLWEWSHCKIHNIAWMPKEAGCALCDKTLDT